MSGARAALRLRVLVVTDAAVLAAAAQTALQREGIEVDLAASAAEALARIESFRPAIVLVDLDLADGAGADLAARLAASPDLGVMTTGHTPSGTRDHVAKPIAAPDLVARVRGLHRRLARPGRRVAGALLVDHARRTITGGGAALMLSDAENLVLATLLEARGSVVSRDWLGRLALQAAHSEDRRIDTLIGALRGRLAAIGGGAQSIRAVRGQGYVIADPAMFRVVAEC